jgi:hypothetical protein
VALETQTEELIEDNLLTRMHENGDLIKLFKRTEAGIFSLVPEVIE